MKGKTEGNKDNDYNLGLRPFFLKTKKLEHRVINLTVKNNLCFFKPEVTIRKTKWSHNLEEKIFETTQLKYNLEYIKTYTTKNMM